MVLDCNYNFHESNINIHQIWFDTWDDIDICVESYSILMA